MRISDWSSDVCSSDLAAGDPQDAVEQARRAAADADATLERLRVELAQAQARKAELQQACDEAASATSSARAELTGIEREHGALVRDRDARQKGSAPGHGLPRSLDRNEVEPGFERARSEEPRVGIGGVRKM